MSKLITAKEAFALSNPEINIDKHIESINTQIKRACLRHRDHASFLLDPCSNKEAAIIAARLHEAGYCCKLDSVADNRMVWFMISWGGS